MGFERAEVMQKVRIILSELFYIQSQIFEQNQLNVTRGPNENIQKQSELFDNDIYLEEITHIICIALAELPSLFNIQEVIETLLYVSNGSTIICWIVANMPDCFKEGTTIKCMFIWTKIFTVCFCDLLLCILCSGDSINIKWWRRNGRRASTIECIECFMRYESRSSNFHSNIVRGNGQNAIAYAEAKLKRSKWLGEEQNGTHNFFLLKTAQSNHFVLISFFLMIFRSHLFPVYC